jgi:eukaryotic-like serine/threonine-protein kinase
MEHEVETLAVRDGDVVSGKYLIRRLLGRGGMGYVVEAEHLQLGHRVALKFLARSLGRRQKAVARFMREGRSVAKLESEHVARMLDVGQLESGDPYLAMELLDGQDLAQVLNVRGTLPVLEAVDYVVQACDAVAEAHSLGIVHRDLKPSNLFVTRRRDGASLVKVLDFGISKAAEEDGSAQSMTATNVVMGSPQYMSPEQVRSAKHVDARADVWGMGTILYELLAGRPPYKAETLTAICAAIACDPVPMLRTFRPDLPAELEGAVMHSLEKDPAKRFQTIAELCIALLPFAPQWAPMLVGRMTRLVGTSVPPAAEGAPGAPGLAPQAVSAQSSSNLDLGQMIQGAPLPPAAVAPFRGGAPAGAALPGTAGASAYAPSGSVLPPHGPMATGPPAPGSVPPWESGPYAVNAAGSIGPFAASQPGGGGASTGGSLSDLARTSIAPGSARRGMLWAVVAGVGLLGIGAVVLVARSTTSTTPGVDSNQSTIGAGSAAAPEAKSTSNIVASQPSELPTSSVSAAVSATAAASAAPSASASARARAAATAVADTPAKPRERPPTSKPGVPNYGGREF